MKNLKKYWYFVVAVFAVFMIFEPIFCFLILGLIMLYLGIEYKITIDDIEQNGTTVEGKIIKYTRDHEGYQTPTINFSTKKGESIEREPYYYSATDFNKFRNFKNFTDKPISVKYNPKNPEQFVIDGKYRFNKATIYFIIFISLIFLTIGTLSIVEIIDLNF